MPLWSRILGFLRIKEKFCVPVSQKCANPASSCLFSFFQQQFYWNIIDFSLIRIQIFGVWVEHADHLATNTAQKCSILFNSSSLLLFVASYCSYLWLLCPFHHLIIFNQCQVLSCKISLSFVSLCPAALVGFEPTAQQTFDRGRHELSVHRGHKVKTGLSGSWSKALWLVKSSHVTWTIQSERFISV